MGQVIKQKKTVLAQASEDALVVDTMGGRMHVPEQRGQSYLLRLRKTGIVKRLIERLFTRQDWTRATQASQGWQAIEDSLKLVGWSKAGRVVVLRRRVKNDLALTVKKRGTKGKSEPGQVVLALPADEVQDSAQMWEYTALVTDVKYELAAIGQIYGDRCDYDNGFDEPQRQWEWGGSDCICRKIFGQFALPTPPPALTATG